MPTLIINRTNEYANRWRAIDIYVDGQKTGVIGSGETKEFDILPGAHIVNCKIDWCGSNDVQIDISGNEVKLLTQNEMEKLFPDGKVYKEMFWGLTKSITMYRFPEPALDAK